MKDVKRFLAYLGKYKLAYWLIFTVTIIASVTMTLLYPYVNKMVFNSVEYGNQKLFTQAVVFCIILVVLNGVFPYLRYFEMRVVRKLVFDIKIRMFHKLMKMDFNYYERHHSGEALKTLNWDANCLKDAYFSHIYWVSIGIVKGMTSVVAMLIYSPIMTLISVSFCFITACCSVGINKQIKKMDKKIQQNVAVLAERLSDILSGFTLMKMYSGSSIVIDSFQHENEEVNHKEKERVRTVAVLEMLSFFLGILGNFGTIIAGALLVSRGQLDYGTVMAVVSLQMGVASMMQSFGSSLATFTSSIVRSGRVFDFLELDCEEKDGIGKLDEANVSDIKLAVDIDKLSFAYDGENKVLNEFDLKVKENEKILIMGDSGCGKSTLLMLLMRFYDRTDGKIQIKGKDIYDYSLEELRDMITYIPQNNYLFEGTIKENIAMGSKQVVTDEEVVNAAKFAYAHEFIKEFPMGYDTPLSAGGSNLSGGQRQRIAIARAFLKNSPILLMDEPSSALDVHSEKKINLAMTQLMENKVVLMVTHRTTGTADFDRVIKLEKNSAC